MRYLNILFENRWFNLAVAIFSAILTAYAAYVIIIEHTMRLLYLIGSVVGVVGLTFFVVKTILLWNVKPQGVVQEDSNKVVFNKPEGLIVAWKKELPKE